MKAYKIMRKKYHEPGATILTKNVQYGNRIRSPRESFALAEAAINVCSHTNATFGQMIDLLLDIQMTPSSFGLPSNVTRHHAEKLKPLALAAQPIQAAFGSTFWESLYERVRRDEKPSCPSRMDSYFACRDLETLRRYRDKHWPDKMGDKLVCEVSISDCPVVFEADMVILDEIDGAMNFSSAAPIVRSYWDQKFSKQPILEILLQGSVLLDSEVEI